MTSSELMKLQLAWLDQGLDEYESQIRVMSYLDAGLDPDLAAAAVSAELYLDEMAALGERVERMERTLVLLTEKIGRLTGE